ncbi:vitamin K epoxide reductase family protein [Chelativorans sp. AA-79]|uniref:vitamin K epoxide reductase family protein n=1 Tax=Chelativorans sp. AA-79 TaxID=3028735 RepID=UPI0023F652C8|nr:vitamin K epoxide reductase family protein [Chelativorans sp. AA-79]WEX09809.1 vitamin K epoxide reductase family protein [Chelativorans sp. AA-79]
MRQYLMDLTSPGLSPRHLRRSLQENDSRAMDYRRAIVGASLIGIASMAVVTLLQTGIVRHLPDPPTRRPHFDSDKVNSSEEAYSYGMPDGPLAIAMHAMNLVFAAAGPPDRFRWRPWLPLAAAFASAAQAAIAAKYLFYQMPKVDKAWCPYCIVDALTHFATFALTLPELARVMLPRRLR